MQTVLHRAKSWLDEAQNIDEVRNAKAVALGYETVIREKEMAFDAQLAATEIVRRCERRVGELVKTGQENGSIRKQGDGVYSRSDRHLLVHRDELVGAVEAVGANHRSELVPLRAMAAATPDQFDAAIAEHMKWTGRWFAPSGKRWWRVWSCPDHIEGLTGLKEFGADRKLRR
jgi:hypothetical protein